MKRLLFLLGCSSALLAGADLAGVRNVYVLPMSRGLDQYLANRIVGAQLFQIVTDPKLADAVFSDRFGESLQFQLETIFPTPKPPDPEPVEAEAQPAKPEKKAVSKRDKDKDKDKADGPVGSNPLITDTVNHLDNPASNSTFGRSKGNIFLVDAKSRMVLWSTYDPPKGADTKDLDRTASDIVSRLKKDLTPKKK